VTALIAELGDWRQSLATVRTLYFQLVPTLKTEFGLFLVVKLALGAFHILILSNVIVD